MKIVLRGKKISLAFALCLLIVIAACGGADDTNPSDIGKEHKSIDPKDNEAPKEDKPVVLRLYGPATGLSIPSGVQTDPVSKEIERVTGVTIDLETHPDDNKFNAMMASGDFPDVLVITGTASQPGPTYTKPLIESKRVLPLEDLIAQHAPNIQKLDKLIEFSKKYYSNDTGELYFLPGVIDPHPSNNSGIGPVMRWDYYAELGYPEVKSGDDWLNVVAEMLKKHPKNDEGQKRYGFSVWFDWGYEAIFGHTGDQVNGLEGKISTVTGRGGYMEFNIKTEEITPELTKLDSALWKGVEFYYKANKMGLMDPDSFTQKWDNHNEKVSADRVLSAQFNWAFDGINGKLRDEGKGYMTIPLNTDAFVQNTAAPMGMSFRLWSIPEGSKSPEKAIKLLDYIFSHEGTRTIYSGVMGEHYVEKGGKLIIPKEVQDASSADPTYKQTMGIGKYGNFAGFGLNTIDPKYDQPLNLSTRSDSLEVQQPSNALDQSYMEHYGLTSMSEMNNYLKQWTFDGTITGVMEKAPEDIKLIDTKIKNYLDTALVNLLLSKNDQEYTDGKMKIIEDVKQMGYEKSNVFWTKAWNDALVEARKYR